MFARLLVIVIAAGATGLGVLTLRQQQLRAGHELAQARLELMQAEERIRRVRVRIAEQTSPENVRLLGDALGELVPARPRDSGQNEPPAWLMPGGQDLPRDQDAT